MLEKNYIDKLNSPLIRDSAHKHANAEMSRPMSTKCCDNLRIELNHLDPKINSIWDR